MEQLTLLGFGVAAAALLVWYLSFSAARLDRLHARVEGARSALDAQLVRRSSATLQLAGSGVLDPATALLLAAAATAAQQADDDEREAAESALTATLAAAFAEPEVVAQARAAPRGAALLDDLETACRRVQLARRFHNDAVGAARIVRRKRVVRWLRLAGRAPLPGTVELDDTLPVPAGVPTR